MLKAQFSIFNFQYSKIMAERKIAFNIAFKKNDNQYNAGYGQYYPEAYSGTVLSLRGLIERVARSRGQVILRRRALQALPATHEIKKCRKT